MAKNLYHRDLKAMGVVSVTVKTGPLKSKYPNKPDYVGLVIHGVEYNYNTENPACAAFFNGQAGRTFSIKADGGGKDQAHTATITYVGESAANMTPAAPPPPPPSKPPVAGTPPPPPGHTTPPAPATTASPPQPPAGGPPQKDWKKEIKSHIWQNAVLQMLAIEALTVVREQYLTAYGHEMPQWMQQSVYGGLLYGSNGKGYPQGLPVDYKLTSPKPPTAPAK